MHRQLLQVLLDLALYDLAQPVLDQKEPIRRTRPFDPLVGTLVVVVFHPHCHPLLAVFECLERGPRDQFVLDRLPEPLEFSQRLRMVRGTSDMFYIILFQLFLEPAPTSPTDVLTSVVRQHFLRQPAVAHRRPVRLDHIRGPLRPADL